MGKPSRLQDTDDFRSSSSSISSCRTSAPLVSSCRCRHHVCLIGAHGELSCPWLSRKSYWATGPSSLTGTGQLDRLGPAFMKHEAPSGRGNDENMALRGSSAPIPDSIGRLAAAADSAVDSASAECDRHPWTIPSTTSADTRSSTCGKATGTWVRTYEQTVQDEMDLRLLERVQTVDWSAARSVLDLACGTGRIGVWLSRHCSAAAVDGVDLTPEMLDVARSRGVYRISGIADVSGTGLPAETYDLCMQSLADEHLPDLGRSTAKSGASPSAAGTLSSWGFIPSF